MKEMDEDEYTQTIEMDNETGSDKKTRRSSILKPQKPRNPLSTLDFSEANPDNTLGRATRRVSFASSNFVKPFAADPEKNTIWDTTYEEEINHTDSTKSSCDQTHASKASDFLNTSLYSPYKAVDSVDVSERKLQTVVNSGESLVSLARKLRSTSVDNCVTATMDFTLVNKTRTEILVNDMNKENVKLNENLPSFRKVGFSSTIVTENTMEMTCLTDKENVNPLINDPFLVMPKRNLHASNATKYLAEDEEECAKSNEKTVYFNTSENNLDFTGLDANEVNCAIDKSDNTKNCTSVMDFTCATDKNGVESTEEEHLKEQENKSKRKTILFSETEGVMDFTIVNNDNLVNTETKPETHRTIIFNQSQDDMEFTTTLPVKLYENKENPDFARPQETICFNDSVADMEFTNTFPVGDPGNAESNKAASLTGKLNNNVNCTVTQAEDMEITTVLSTETIERIPEKVASDKMEVVRDTGLNSTLQRNVNKSKLCDMSLTVNLCTVNVTNENNGFNVMECEEKVCSSEIQDANDVGNDYLAQNRGNSSCNLKKSFFVDDLITDGLHQNGHSTNHESGENDSSKSNVSKDASIETQITSKDVEPLRKNATQRALKHSLHEKSGLGDRLSENSFTEFKPKKLKPTKTDDWLDRNFSSRSETAPDTDFQTSTLSNSNVLYSEPMKVKLKSQTFVPIPDLSANLNLEGSLNMEHVTPATSFHINLTTMSPCIEDTQQLIHATFSKPETLKILDKNADSSFVVLGEGEDVLPMDENVLVPSEESDDYFIKMSNQTRSDEKSCFLRDTSPLALVLEDFDNSDSKIVDCPVDTSTSSDSNVGNYTLRSQLVLKDIEKHLIAYKPKSPRWDFDFSKLAEEFESNCRLIKEICQSKVELTNLETLHKQYLEESLSSAIEEVSGSDGDSVAPALGLIAPKSLSERIRETAERSKQYWEFVKMENDYCYFYTLFSTMPFKVHIHPELGMVYSIKTYSNLSDLAGPMCCYQLSSLRRKLRWENLVSVLGAKFDIFTLLDYVYMSMEEIINFHAEYRDLLEKYGRSHRFRMNSDCSISFEILNVRHILFWTVSVKMPTTSFFSVSKEDVTAVHRVGKIVNEEHIKTIAENTPKGLNFLRNFMENVEEYTLRLEKKPRR